MVPGTLQDKDLLSIQEARVKVEKAYAAWRKFRAFSQEQVDAVVERMAAAARVNARHLAELAVEETGYGNSKSKYVKNLLACDWLPRKMRGMKTVGIVRELPDEKIIEIAEPVGVVAAILPTTNPTSTAIYKTLISLKAGNAIVVSPHPRAFNCSCSTVAILYQAAIEADAPEDIIQCIETASVDATNVLMKHPRTSVILATGGHGMVKAAYSSGKPAYGVGPGNVPSLIDISADIEEAVARVVAGKSFDYGTLCSSEQAIVAESAIRDRVLAALKANGAYLANEPQKEALANLLIAPNWTVNPHCVGQAPGKIALMAGFEVPQETSVICVELSGVGKEHPLSAEKLSPVLSLYFVSDFSAALETCHALLRFGGTGHTASIHATNDARIREFGLRMPAMRVLVNTPAPHGSVGITTNVFPAMTLGCGAVAGNATSDNIGPQHLFNIKRVAYAVRKPQEAFEMPMDIDAAPAVSAGFASAAPVDRAAVVSAVERYLASRGFAAAAAASAGGSASAPAPNVVADVVDRFLAKKAAPEPAGAGYS